MEVELRETKNVEIKMSISRTRNVTKKDKEKIP